MQTLKTLRHLRRNQNKKLLILQMGKERTLVEFVNGPDEGKVYMVENNYLMMLDEMGIVL